MGTDAGYLVRDPAPTNPAGGISTAKGNGVEVAGRSTYVCFPQSHPLGASCEEMNMS